MAGELMGPVIEAADAERRAPLALAAYEEVKKLLANRTTERDAALDRVADLEDQLASLESKLELGDD